MKSNTQKNKILKFICLIFIAIAFFVITDIIDTTPYLSTNNNKVLANLVEIPIPDPVEKMNGELLWERFISFAQKIAFPVLGMMIGVAGILFITSGGDPNKIRIAWKMIVFSLIGLLIILSADPLARTIVEILQR